MKHAYLITDTAYKMLYQFYLIYFFFLIYEIMYRYEIRKNVQNQNTDLSNIEIRKVVF